VNLRTSLALLGLAISSAAAALLLAEIGLRAWAPPGGMPLLLQTSAPDTDIENRHGTAAHEPFGVSTFDEHGFRIGSGMPFDQSVLFLGDSFTEGRGVGDDETFARVAERALRREGLHVRSLNAGQRGFGAAQELKVLRRMLARFPVDAIVLQVFPMNDLSDNLADGTFGVVDGRLVEHAVPRLPLRARLSDLIAQSWLQRLYIVRAVVNRLQSADPAAPYESPTSLALEQALLKEIIATARTRGLAVVVLVVPTTHVQEKDTDHPFARLWIERFERVLEIVKGLDVAWIDAGSVIPDLAADAATSDGGHFGKEGNRLIGEAIAEKLLPVLRARADSKG